MNLNQLIQSFLSLFYPKLCVICQAPLLEPEEHLCLACSLNLPKTGYHRSPMNRSHERFSGKYSLEKASSFFYYNKEGTGQKIITEVKYKGNIRFGYYLGSYIAKEMQSSGFFDGIDYLIPVPLHRRKKRERGFNQTEVLVRGIAAVVNIAPDTSSLIKKRSNASQTKKNVYSRWLNTQDIYLLKGKEKFVNKHILLVDDVLTTGATLMACIQCFHDIPGIRISILTVAIA